MRVVGIGDDSRRHTGVRPRGLNDQPASLSSNCGAPFHDGVALASAAWTAVDRFLQRLDLGLEQLDLGLGVVDRGRLGDGRVGGRVRLVGLGGSRLGAGLLRQGGGC